MARAFVTGSSTGLGLMAAQLLLELGHRVVVHGRNQARADVALARLRVRMPQSLGICRRSATCARLPNRSIDWVSLTR